MKPTHKLIFATGRIPAKLTDERMFLVGLKQIKFVTAAEVRALAGTRPESA